MRTTSGTPLALGGEIASGGEGRVFDVLGDSSRVVKIYHAPCEARRQDKLVAMVQMRTSALELVAAWPIDLVWDSNRRCVGFVMPRVAGEGVIDRLSHPAERRRTFPEVDFKFISTVAMNLMTAASALHSAGVVIGDVNESNIVVRKDGTVSFIDADSFQISYRNVIYHCEVGKDLFTPPELQGTNLRALARTPNHDAFGLAVLVFQLFLQGRHPYHGKPLDGQDRQTSEAIRDGAYAYLRRGVRLAEPPAGALSVDALGELADLFDRSFTSRARPSASEWMYALRRFTDGLRPCSANRRHAIFARRSACDLCGLLRDPLPWIGTAVDGPSVNAATLQELIRMIAVLTPPPTLTEYCGEPQITLTERLLPHRPSTVTDEEYARYVVGRAPEGAGEGVVAILIALSLGGVGIALPPALCFALPVLLFGVLSIRDAAKRSSRWKKLVPELDGFRARLGAASQALQELDAAEATLKDFDSTHRPRALRELEALQKAAQALAQYPTELARRKQAASSQFRAEWLRDQLDNFIIRHASITGIGAERARVLASNGIETAADIDRASILRISGFGPVLTHSLVDWRRRCEQVVSSRPVPPMPDTFLSRIEASHAAMANQRITEVKRALDDYYELSRQMFTDLKNESSRIAAARRRYREARRALA
jgi:DNA-binding helix-hairpin-helix protein with protein kinase domain